MEHARINITEFGWNSDKEECNFGVGEINQAAYIMRANLLAARFGVHKVFNYPLIDLPQVYNVEKERLESVETPLYCTTGLIDRSGRKKLSFHATETLVKKLAGRHFIKAIAENYTEEGQVFAFLLGEYNPTTKESKPTHLVAWRASDLGTSDNNSSDYPQKDSELGRSLTTLSLPSSNMEIDDESDYFYLGWDGGKPSKVGNAVVNQNGLSAYQVKVDLSGLPIVIPIKDGGCSYDENGNLDNCNNDAAAPENNVNNNSDAISCGNILITSGDNWITWVGQNGTDYLSAELIDISNTQYNVVNKCIYNCGSTQTYTDLPAGNYILKVFDSDWNSACELAYGNKISLTGIEETSSNNNLATLSCDEVNVQYGEGQITFEGLPDKSYHFKYQLREAPYTQNDCHDCGSSKTFRDLVGGPYEITVDYQSCGLIDLAANSDNSCEDNDGDGVCNDQDCAPWDNNLPKAVGSPCEDNNPDTQHDKILADGCTCEGTPLESNTLATKTCGALTIHYGNGTIEMIGLPDKEYRFSINDMNNGWKEIFSCWSNCGSSQTVTGLRASKYKVKIYGEASTCDTEITLQNSASSRSLPTDLIALGTRIKAQTIYLDWAAGGLADTESFVIEKSLDGTNFKPIKTITPFTSNAQDSGPDYGINYYRIKQQFLNGESRYSPIRTEAYYLDESAITIYPNPAASIVNVSTGQFSNLEGEILIFNRLGYEVANKKLVQTGEVISFDTSAFTSGIYFLIIKPTQGKMQTRQFMVANE